MGESPEVGPPAGEDSPVSPLAGGPTAAQQDEVAPNVPQSADATDDLVTHPDESQREFRYWFSNNESPQSGVPKVARKARLPRLEDRQYFLAVMLIILYAAGNGCLAVGWFMGIEEIATMAAIVGNIGTLVAAVVAFYFAEPKRRK